MQRARNQQPNRNRKTWFQIVLGVVALGILGFVVLTRGPTSEIGLKNLSSSDSPNVDTDIHKGTRVYEEKKYCGIVGLSITKQKGTHTCTGFLIAPKYIMTAGHCCYDEDNSNDKYKIYPDEDKIKVFQAIDFKAVFNYKTVANVYRHANYKPPGTYKRFVWSDKLKTAVENDYCLLEAKDDLLTDFCRNENTFELASVAPKDKEVVRTLGYGATDLDKTANANHDLYLADINVYKCSDKFPQDKRALWKDWNKLGNSYVCAFTEEQDSKNNKGACTGDSGGPLFNPEAVNGKYQVYAITSWGFTPYCDLEMGFFAIVYTDAIHTWVRDITAPKCQAKLMW